ncbi:SNase-like, OB-fold superfamily [Sesbania bispinosa]|nr:SNase-like, OB-fold superfamily [Sesbania bispinosa]
MASTTTGATGWYRGRVKAVPSGDYLVIVAVASSKPGPMPEKTITLSSLMAPRLTMLMSHLHGKVEFLRKFCIGKEVTFKVDYNVPSISHVFVTCGIPFFHICENHICEVQCDACF